MRNRPLVITGMAVILLAAAVWGLWSISRRQTVRLAGGEELTLVAVTQGKTNVIIPGGLWEKLVHRWVPAGGIRIAGFTLRPVSSLRADGFYQDGTIAGPTKAVFWVGHYGGTNKTGFPMGDWFRNIRAEVVDEGGERWEMRPGQSQFFQIKQKRLIGVSAWPFPAFPRRGKTLRLRIYSRNATNGWDQLAEFRASNPTPGPYAIWKASPLPVTQQQGDLEASLVGLVSSLKGIHYMEQDRRPFTLTTFRLKQNGQPTDAWFPDWMEATDATGNEGSFQIIDSGITNGLAFYDAQATSLSPSEVWRLKMRFTHVKDLPTTQLWTSPPLPVQRTTSKPFAITSNFQAYRVGVEYDQGMVDLKLNPAPTNALLRLVDIVDNKGRSIERLGGSAEQDGFLSRLSMPRDAESITVTISLCESVEFEFLAQPTRQ